MKTPPLKIAAAGLLLCRLAQPTATAAEARFTDDNWVSGHQLASFPGGHEGITALAKDEAGALYVALSFPAIGHVTGRPNEPGASMPSLSLATICTPQGGSGRQAGSLRQAQRPLYAAGYFTKAGDQTMNRIAK